MLYSMMKLLVSVLMLSTLVIVNAAGQPTIAPTISSTTFAAVSLQLSSPWPKQGRNQYNLGQSLFAGVRDNSTNWELALISAIPNSPPVIDKNGTVYFGCQHGLFVAVNSDGTLRWTFDANISGGGSISSAALIASDDTVYFGSGPFLFGLNHLGEKVYQSAALGGDIGSGSGPVMGLSGSLYVCATDGFMYAFAPPVTTEKWQFALNNTYSSPLIASGGDIVVGSSDGFLYKLKDNGNSAFQVFKTSMDPSRMTPLTSPVYIESIDQYAVASREGHLYVVSAINGAVFNTYFITTSAADASVSVGSNSALYLGNLGGSVRAINMSTGVILWTKTIGSPVVSTAVISSDELIYVFTDDGVLHCLDGQNAGNQLWAFHTKTPAPYTISPAIGSDGVVYVAVGDGAVRSIGSPAPQCNVAPSYYSSLDVITCVEPTGQPTGQPTRQPSSSLPTFTTTPVPTAVPSTAAPTAPTSVPTSHPSYVPSYVPSGQPTSVPSQAPSTALQSEVTLTAVTRLTSISAAQFENGTANTAAFKETVASVIGNHVSSSDVIIVNVTDTSTVRRVRGRVLATSSCDIGWTVTYVSQVVNPAATTDSTASTVESLVNTATNDGSFDAMLVSLAPSLTGVSAGLPVFSPTIFVAIVKSAFPTSQPSGQPSGPPTGQPSGQPSIQPSSQPSSYPSREPSSAPSVVPTGQPSGQPTGVPTGQPTGQPTAQPTSSPSCNAGSYDVVNIDGVVGTRGCEICPAGTYSGAGGSVKCTKCPLDTYSDSVGSDHCTQCPWPSSTDSVGKTECYGYRLTSQFSIVATVLSAVLAIYIFCWLSSGGESIAVTVNMIMPMLDHLTDINYVMFERFHRPFMFGLAVLFLFAPCMVFTYELYEKGYRPYFLIPFTVLWLETNSDGNPKHVDFDLNIGGVSLTPSAQDSLTKLLWYWIFWGICIAVQAATLVFLLVWVVMYSCFIILWWFLGTLLYQSRNLAVGKISLMWYSTWNPVVFEELGVKAEKVDRGLMNRALFSGFVLETVPQLMLQVVNNTSKDSGAWSVTSIASTTMSVYMCISGLYRFAYYHWYRGYSFDDIPIATIAIPGVDKKYTSLNGRSGDSEARHVRAADRMIRTVSKYVPKSESATNKTHQRRSTFSDGTTAYRELLSEGVYTTDAAGTVHRVPTTLHSVLTAQVGLLNDEYSYDHARIKQAKDTIVVTTIGDGRKNRMIAVSSSCWCWAGADLLFLLLLSLFQQV